MLLPNAKMVNLKVSASQILDLQKRFWISSGHDFIGKKVRTSRDSALELFVRNPEIKKRNICMFVGNTRKMLWQ